MKLAISSKGETLDTEIDPVSDGPAISLSSIRKP